MPPSRDYYQILGLPRDASPDEIRRAYREAARRLHPDVTPNDRQAADAFLQVREAYETLSEPQKRVKYDQTLLPELHEIGYEVAYSRPSLPSLDEQQLSYVLLRFSAPPGARNTPPPPINLCLVVDISTSMSGHRLDVVKDTTIQLLRQLKPNDRFSLVTFNDRAEVIAQGWQADQTKKIETDIRMLQADGGTEIYQGLEAGYKTVHHYYNPKYINHIVLLTDGRTYGDEDRCFILAHQAHQHDIGISSLGIGDEWNDEFLDRLANITGGSVTFVAHSTDIKNYLQDKFFALSHIFANQVTYQYADGMGAKLQYAFRIEPDVMPIEEHDGRFSFGQIPLDGRLTILLEFLVHPIPPATSRVYLSQGQISMQIPLHSDPDFAAPLHLNQKVGTDEQAVEPPKTIIHALSKITLYRMQQRAQQEIEQGQINVATQRLQNIATHLLSQGEHKLARQVFKEIDQINETHVLSPNGKKHIKYGTRSLLLPSRVEGNIS